MAVGLLFGGWLARKKRFGKHGRCQSLIVLLNLAVVAVMMVPSFHNHVMPKIPAKLGKAYYALATVHGVLGVLAEVAAVYIVLSAGTRLLPEKIRIARFKLWMRTVLVLWWAVVLLGIATYTRWYVSGFFRS